MGANYSYVHHCAALLSLAWLDPADVIDAERKEPACLMDLIIKWGDHGVNTKKNLFLVYGVSIIKKNRAGRRFPFRHHLSTLFPKMDNMKGNYAYIQNCPGLLAFAWFHRLARTIKNRLVIRTVTNGIWILHCNHVCLPRKAGWEGKDPV